MTAFEDNAVLALLSRDDRLAVAPLLHPVVLPFRQVLTEANKPLSHVYFLLEGLGSTVIASPDGNLVETLLIGRDGYAGVCVVLGPDRAPTKIFMQTDGRGLRMSVSDLLRLFDERPGFRRAMLAYAYVAQMQTAFTALSNAAHRVEQRLARWLLMAHDRLRDDIVPLTHEALSLMLNVRRSSVTDALHLVEGQQLIRSLRGRVVIRDRAGLEALAAAAYGVPEAEARRMLNFVPRAANRPEHSAPTSGLGLPTPA